MTLNEVSVPALGVEERSDEAPGPGASTGSCTAQGRSTRTVHADCTTATLSPAFGDGPSGVLAAATGVFLHMMHHHGIDLRLVPLKRCRPHKVAKRLKIRVPPCR